MGHAHLARQRGQQRLPVLRAVRDGGPGRRAPARKPSSSASNAACASGAEASGSAMSGRRHAVEHHAPHALRILPQVLQRRAGAVGRADQVDALGAQRLAHRIQVVHRQRRGVAAQVAVRQRAAAVRGTRELRCSWRCGSASSASGARAALRRSPAARCGPVPRWSTNTMSRRLFEARQQRLTGAGQRDRALPRAAGEEEHRVGQLVARQRRQHRIVQVDAHAVGPAPGRARATTCRTAPRAPRPSTRQGGSSAARAASHTQRPDPAPPAPRAQRSAPAAARAAAARFRPAGAAVRRCRSAWPGRRRRRPARP